MSNQPEVIVYSQMKGGVGKSTLLKALGITLAQRDKKKVLLIDGDTTCNLSQMYGIIEQNNTIGEVFKKDGHEVKIRNVGENLDLVPGYLNMSELEDELVTDVNKFVRLFIWMNNQQELLQQYDYVLIDTHPDFKVFTKNAIAVADKVIAPDRPSDVSKYTDQNIEMRMEDFKKEMVDFKTGQSLINASLFTIGNMVEHNTKDSKAFLSYIREKDTYLTYFPKKQLLVRAIRNNATVQAQAEIENYSKNREFVEHFNQSIDQIIEA